MAFKVRGEILFLFPANLIVQAVWALEQKRRENDGRILALHMEIKQMMGVLTQCVPLVFESPFT